MDFVFEIPFWDHFLSSKIGKIIMGYSFPWKTVWLISLVAVSLREGSNPGVTYSLTVDTH